MKPFDSMPQQQRGFSLTEIMVGIVIGMIGIMVIMQTTVVFDAQKGNTTSGDDAQNGGAIALFGLQKEISQAGWGITSPLLIGSPLQTPFALLPALTPVTVNPPQLAGIGDAGTDTVLVIYGNSTNSEGALITNTDVNNLLPYMVYAGTGSNQAIDGGKAFNVGDWVIPSKRGFTACVVGPNCITPAHNLFQVVAAPAGAGAGAAAAPNVGGPAVSPPGVLALTGAPPALQYRLDDTNIPLVFNLGPAPAMLAYAVIGGSLSVCDYFANDCAANGAVAPAGPWQALAGNIMSMRAQCESLSGVRIALVNRSTQRDAQVVTNASPIWNPLDAAGVPTVQNVTPTPAAWGADWDHYRYKTFETVIPIRNAVWTGLRGC